MSEFAYAVGRIRTLETFLLDENKIIRMIDAKDLTAAYLVLRENNYYSEKIDQLEHPFDFEALLELELKSTRELIDKLAPENEILNVFWEKYSPLPLSEYLKKLKHTASKYQIPIFTKYADAFVTLNQIKLDLLEGKVDLDSLSNLYRHTDFYTVVSAGIENFKKSGSLWFLEREIDNCLMKIMKQAKYKAFGIEPLLGFSFAKETEIKLLRLILVSKRFHIKPEIIKERLRFTYV